jgi:hypothetical protein
MMAWRDQKLPFDISNQRVIMEGRSLLDIPVNKTRLVAFIHEAEAGHFYRPMEAVGRVATLEHAATSLGSRSLLGALIREVRDLRGKITPHPAHRPRAAPPRTLKNYMGGKGSRKQLFLVFANAGGSGEQWRELTASPVSEEERQTYSQWNRAKWEDYVKEKARPLSRSPVVAPVDGPMGSDNTSAQQSVLPENRADI